PAGQPRGRVLRKLLRSRCWACVPRRRRRSREGLRGKPLVGFGRRLGHEILSHQTVWSPRRDGEEPVRSLTAVSFPGYTNLGKIQPNLTLRRYFPAFTSL